MVFKWFKRTRAEAQAKAESEREPPRTEQWREIKTRVFSTRDFSVFIVGESNYQPALRRAKDAATNYDGAAYVTAVIAREPDNPYDAGAVKVMNGELEIIGYLSRDLALSYREAVEFWESAGYFIRCQAKLIGGQGRRKSIGAWLDLDTPEAIDAKFHDPRTRR